MVGTYRGCLPAGVLLVLASLAQADTTAVSGGAGAAVSAVSSASSPVLPPCTGRVPSSAPAATSSPPEAGSPQPVAGVPCKEPPPADLAGALPENTSGSTPENTSERILLAEAKEGDPAGTGGNVLRTISVTAPKVEKDPSRAPVTLNVISVEEIQEMVATSIKDVIRYEPGISVSNNGSRFGLGSINIRGLDENRILIQMDGIRQPDSFAIGGFSNAGRNMVDVGMLSGVDIQRGAGSALQGSEGIGGVVSFRSPEPEDFLRGRSFAASPEAIYQGVDRSLGLIGTLAAGNDIVKLMLRGVQRTGQELANKGDVGGFGFDRTKPNPQDINTLNGLAKLVFTPFPGYRATLVAEGFERVVDTNYMSYPRLAGRVDVNATDTYRRGRFSLDQRLSGSRLGMIDLKFYRQISRTGQLYYDEGRQIFQGSLNKTLTERQFFFEQILTGTRLQTESIFELLGAHTLIWGAEAFRTDTRQMRDGMILLSNGSTTKNVGPDLMPISELPPSSTTQVALFFQDNWLLMDRLTLVTGLRYDNYHLHPKPDQLFRDRHPTTPTSAVRHDAFSPKASLIFDAGWGFSLVAQYSQGFRPPPYNNVNIGFSNFSSQYVAVANPDLKPEIVRGVELSVRHHSDRGYASFTAFDNRYEDFINSFVTLDCPGDPLCSPIGFTTYQARNIPKARIYGFEGRLDQRLPWGFRLRGAFAWAKGRDLVSGLPIIQVNPPTGVLGLAWERGPFRIEGLVTAAMRKTLKESRGVTRMIQPPAYSVVDLLAQWRFSPNGRLNVGIFNLFDEKYWHWADVPVKDIHVAETQGGPDRYTRPGRSFSISISHRF